MSAPSAASAAHPASAPAAVAVHDLHKSFGSLNVLRGITLSAAEGEVVAIIGGSGSGKSTLLRCINLLETPTSGTLKIHGETVGLKTTAFGQTVPANRRQVQRVRTRLAMVFQSFALWQHMSLIANVMEAPIHVLGVSRAEAMARAESLIERVGLSDKRDVYPAFLSGGQQQRAAIARALAMEPSVLLFDEPTSALDPELVGEVLSVIRSIAAEGRTMLIVTHEMAFAREVADRVVFLADGQIEEEGPPAEIFGAPRSERLRRFLANFTDTSTTTTKEPQ